METLTTDLGRIWRRWEARFIGVGLDYNVLQKLKARITRWEEWCQAFSAEAADREAFGDEAMAHGRTLTAANAWAQAALLYHLGGMYFITDMAQFEQAHRCKVAAYARAAPLLCPPAERVEVSFEGVAMPGYLTKPAGVERPPVVILYNGFEGVKEEGQMRLGELLDRGLATFTFDGPGRGETWPHLPMTGNYGPATAAIIDALEQRPDVDATRIGATGPNRGAFVAAKAAAYDSRIRACAFASPGYDRRETAWDDPYQLAFDQHLFHLDSVEALRDRLQQLDLTLEGEASRIHCPTLIIAGGRDAAGHRGGSQRLFDELSGPKEYVVFPDAERNGNNVPFKVRPRIADYLVEHLGGSVRGCH